MSSCDEPIHSHFLYGRRTEIRKKGLGLTLIPTKIVQRVKHPEDIETVLNCFL
jgi:hypothetical protein